MVAYPQSPVLKLLAATPAAGFALQNGTPNILTWTAPADGKLHRVFLWAMKVVSSAETGGAIGYQWTTPDGSHFSNYGIDVGGNAAGFATQYAQPWNLMVESGSTITLNQTSALTAGASIEWAEFWGM